MREGMPLPPKEGKKRKVYFIRGEETLLDEIDYKFLLTKKNCQFKFLVDEGSLIVSDLPKEEEPKPLSKKEQKKLDAAKKKAEKKKASDDKKSRQAK